MLGWVLTWQGPPLGVGGISARCVHQRSKVVLPPRPTHKAASVTMKATITWRRGEGSSPQLKGLSV